MNDHDVLEQVRDGLSGLHMSTQADTIIARARTRRRRQQVTGASAAGVAACTALTLGLTGIMSSGNAPPARSGPSQGHARLEAAFTITSGPHGSSKLTLRKGGRPDPATLRRALARHGIPALVTVGRHCDTASPQPAGLTEVITSRRTSGGTVTLTIKPAAMPAGSVLSIGVFPAQTSISLVRSGARLICTKNLRMGDGQHANKPARPGQPARHLTSGTPAKAHRS